MRIHNYDKLWITPYSKNLISEHQTAFAQHKLINKVKREIRLKLNEMLKELETFKKLSQVNGTKELCSALTITNIPGIDNNNVKDMAKTSNTKFVSVTSHIEPSNISTLPAYLSADDSPPGFTL